MHWHSSENVCCAQDFNAAVQIENKMKCIGYAVYLIDICKRFSVLLVLTPVSGHELQGLRCKSVIQTTVINETWDHCLCYVPESNIKWYQLWSTVQAMGQIDKTTEFPPLCTLFTEDKVQKRVEKVMVYKVPRPDGVHPRLHIYSAEAMTVVRHPNTHNCKEPENGLVYFTCMIQSIWKPEESKEIYLNLNGFGEKVCFDVKFATKPTVYTVEIIKTEFSAQLLILFFGGVFLFCSSSSLSRSAAVFYSAGITLGIAASLVFLLLMFKRFIPKNSTFWLLMSGCCFFTAYSIQYLKENIKWLWNENKHFILGYFAIAGLLSFAACYKNGPLTSQRSIDLFTWTLQFIACFMIYLGLTFPEVSYAVIVVLISSKGLRYPFRAFCYLCRLLKSCITRKKLEVKFLTEEEYQEEAERETSVALENLRAFCNSPDFNSWLTVSWLTSPKKFAEFILGSSHVSAEEANAYEEQYGFGSSFLEEQLFVQEEEAEQIDHTNIIQENNESEIYQANDLNNFLQHDYINGANI